MKHIEPIFEYTYDKPTLDISRAIINRFKKFIHDDEIPGDFMWLGRFHVIDRELPIGISFHEGSKTLVSAETKLYKEKLPWEIYVIIRISYRVGGIRQDFNNLVVELKDAIRHELEHVGQMIHADAKTKNKGKASIDWFLNVDDSALDKKGGAFQYYMADHETEAFVKGLLKKAKTKRTDLEDEIINYVDSRNLTALQKWRVKKKWFKYAQKHKLLQFKPISKTYAQNNESSMNAKVVSFKEFQAINEKGGSGLKALVGKEAGEELSTSDAKRIGQKISKMSGKNRQKYIGIVNFMGASCKVFNTIWANYSPVDKNRKAKNEKKPFNKEVPGEVSQPAV